MALWKKLGRIYNPTDFPDRPEWQYEYALSPWTIVLEDVVRVFFGCRPPRDANGQRVTHTSYLDLDRSDLFNIRAFAERPVLDFGTRGCFDEFGTYPLSCIQRDVDPPGRLLGFYAGWTRCESVPFNVGIGAAISKDNGKSFEKLGQGPILPFSTHEPFTLSGPKIRKFGDTYYLFYIAGRQWLEINGHPEISHKIRLATSSDGLNWKKLDRDLIPNAWDENEAQASPDVFFANGRYHMFFCGWIPSSFRTTLDRRIGYAWSLDLVNWTRDDSLVGIGPSNEGWDSQMVAYPHLFELDDQVYLIYIGNEVGRFGFGLAQLVGDL
jgi:hypothetical protein